MLGFLERAPQFVPPPSELGDDVLCPFVGDGKLAEPSVDVREACGLLLRAHERQVEIRVVGDPGAGFLDRPQAFQPFPEGVLGLEVFLARFREAALQFGERLARLCPGAPRLADFDRKRPAALERLHRRGHDLNLPRHLGERVPDRGETLGRSVRVVPLEDRGQDVRLGARARGELIGALLDLPVDLEREQAREDRTTLLRLATQERVELVLRQEHHAREGVVVEPEELLDFLRRLPDASRQ